MRVLSAGYVYRPEIARERTVSRTRKGGYLRKRVLLVLLGGLLFLPWGWTGYRFHQVRTLERQIALERERKEKLLSEWERLTAEEVVKRHVAPLGLFKPTKKEIIRLP